MRSLTIASVALLVLFAGVGMANASTVTLSFVFNDGAFNPATDHMTTDGSTGPMTLTYKVFATVTDNTYVTATHGTQNLGLKAFTVNEGFTTNDGLMAQGEGSRGAPDIVVPTYYGVNAGAGTIVKNGTATSAVNNIRGSFNFPSDTSFLQDDYLYENQWGFGNPLHADIPGSSTPNMAPVMLYSGTINALGNGIVTMSAAMDPTNSRVSGIIAGENTLTQYVPDVVNPASVNIQIGEAGPTPTIAIDQGDQGKDAWTGAPGWNTPTRTLPPITTTSTNASTFQWFITPAGGVMTELAGETASSIDLTIQKIIDAVGAGNLPTDPTDNPIWTLTVQANGVTGPTSSINVFVPEPTTIGLLGFGLVALLKRRRA